jgi:hypothetical protein
MTTHPRAHRANAMHPANAIPFAGRGHYRPDPRRATPRATALRGAALATFIGTALAAVLFVGLSGAFRP